MIDDRCNYFLSVFGTNLLKTSLFLNFWSSGDDILDGESLLSVLRGDDTDSVFLSLELTELLSAFSFKNSQTARTSRKKLLRW